VNDWLAAHAADLPPLASGDTLPLYLVLSHAQCLTDNVPIPGEPCRDDSELMQASRVADGFRLDLRLAPPPQREEDAIRDFVAWLLDVPLAASSPPLDEEAFVEQLRAAAHAWLAPTSPPTSPPDYMIGSAPAGTSEQLLTTALRLWTTELRPLWMARADCGCNAEPIAPRDDALLLAELDVTVIPGSPNLQVSDAEGAVRQDERRRPCVLSLRMLQELITLHPVPDPAETVASETSFDQAPAAGVSLHYARADHTHGTPPLPTLEGDVQGAVGSTWIDALQGVKLLAGSPLVDGQVLTVQGGQWVPQALPPPPPPPALPALGGDLTGTVPNAHVASLQGVTLVTPTTLINGEVLTLSGGQWKPMPLPTPAPAPTAAPLPSLGGDLSGPIANARIASLQGAALVAPATLTENHVLTVQGGQWVPKALPPPPPPPTPAPLPALAGDVTGTIPGNTITSLQKMPVVAPAPNDGDVLFFDGTTWIPKALDAGANLQCVGRGNELPYDIVAAAEVTIVVAADRPPISRKFDHRYGALTFGAINVGNREATIEFILQVADPERTGFMVKLTPIRLKFPSLVCLAGRIKTGDPKVTIPVLLETAQTFEGEAEFAFQIEISHYAEKLT
jgi:hypothetical protein